MLTPSEVIPFLQHDDPIVRKQAVRYFDKCHDLGPLTADHYWAIIDRFGEIEETLHVALGLQDLPQTNESLQRLLRAINSKAPEDFDYHYQHAAREIELPLLVQHRDEILGCRELLPRVKKHLELRLSLLDRPPAGAWDQLIQLGRDYGHKFAGEFDTSLNDALVEAAARGGAEVCQRAIETLADKTAEEDWREIFAADVLGRARYEPAIDALVNKLGFDTDVMREKTNRALSRIGGIRVIESVVNFYPGKPWHVRLYADDSLSHIKRPESEDALLKLLAIEVALAENPHYNDEGDPLIEQVLQSLSELCSLAGLDEFRRLIKASPDDLEVLSIREPLIATAIMTGTSLPEESAWRKSIEEQESRPALGGNGLDEMFRRMRDRWRESGLKYQIAEDEPEDRIVMPPTVRSTLPGDYAEPARPIRNAAPKTGRNDPCPCGSGKKYKKCCGK
jgi:hypothetical protein